MPLARLLFTISPKWRACSQAILVLVRTTQMSLCEHLPLSGMDNRAATALSADLLSSSCFSNSCFTEFAFTFVCNVARKGSTRISTPADKNERYCIVEPIFRGHPRDKGKCPLNGSWDGVC